MATVQFQPKQRYFCMKMTWKQDLQYIITEESHLQKDCYFDKKATQYKETNYIRKERTLLHE